MRKVTVGDFAEAEFEGRYFCGIITAAKRNPDNGEWFVKISLADMMVLTCSADNLIDCVFVMDGE